MLAYVAEPDFGDAAAVEAGVPAEVQERGLRGFERGMRGGSGREVWGWRMEA